MTRSLLHSFLAGFLATLIFHQGGLLLFWALGVVPNFPWNMTPVPPFQVPSILSLSFFGGLWGIPCYFLAKKFSQQTFKYWASLIIFGAIFPTAVAMLVVFPLKSIPVNSKMILGGLILNGLWGLGVALSLKLTKALPRS